MLSFIPLLFDNDLEAGVLRRFDKPHPLICKRST